MRTTVTLDSDVEKLLREAMRGQGLSFKEALNQSLRASLTGLNSPAKRKPFRQKTWNLGVPKIDLAKALSIAAELEDDEHILKMQKTG